MDWNKKIKLRKLKTEDAEPMLTWMKNPDIYKNMQYNPEEQTLERCRVFIENSWTDESNLHFAVTDADERYMGTVSLKNVDHKNSNAEFAIALCTEYMGKGIASAAMAEIMSYAFETLGLQKVYLYVRKDNERAVKFYEKMKLRFEGCFEQHLCVQGEFKDILWYALKKDEYPAWHANFSE